MDRQLITYSQTKHISNAKLNVLQHLHMHPIKK